MAKPNYQFEKRQRDLAKKLKQEEKRQQKLADKVASADVPPIDTPQDSVSPAQNRADDGMPGSIA